MPRTPWPPLVRASLLTLFCLLGACIDSSGILPQAGRLAAQQLDPGADLRGVLLTPMGNQYGLQGRIGAALYF